MGVQRVLFVGSDSEYSRDFLKTVKNINHLRYIPVQSVEDTLSAVKTGPYAGVVIGEIKIPKSPTSRKHEKHGMGLIKKLTKEEIPVIFLSRDEDHRIMEEVEDAGAKVVLLLGEGAFHNYFITSDELFNSEKYRK